MNPKLTLALVASLTSTAFAAFQAPLPEFKNEKQLAEWRAEKSSGVTSQGYVAEETAFYTGKPYLSSSGGYAFKYRSYNPELARWTSEDPSGFPDGANQNVYAPKPTMEIDFSGLFSVDLNSLGKSSNTWTDSTTLRTYTVATTDMSVLTAADFNATLSGWTFTAGSLNETMKIETYAPFALDGYGLCNFMASINGPLLASENWGWVQIVTCNTPGGAGKTGTFLDNIADQSNPFYRGTKGIDFIVDQPSRPYDQIGTMPGGGAISWEGQTYFVKSSGNDVTVFGGVKWKFTIE